MTDRPLRVLFVAPWFATLATGWARALRDLGHDTVTVTSSLHFDPPPLLDGDVRLELPWRSRAGGAELARAARLVRGFEPDVVITEPGRDPRFTFLALATGAPVLVTTHDAEPHDGAHRPPVMRALAGRVLDRRAAGHVVFSRHVAGRLRQGRPRDTRPIHVLPLTSELPQEHVPEPVPAEGRRDVLVVGRLSPYKNLPLVLSAWERHRHGPAYRGDRLVVIGDGDPGCALPEHVVWERGRFAFADLAPRLAAAKASLVLYERGSQSGVQVTSMQCGTTAVPTDVGGLAEYVPPDQPCVRPGDAAGAAAVLDELADPSVAAGRGSLQRRWYDQHCSAPAAARAWEPVLAATAAAVTARRRSDRRDRRPGPGRTAGNRSR